MREGRGRERERERERGGGGRGDSYIELEVVLLGNEVHLVHWLSTDSKHPHLLGLEFLPQAVHLQEVFLQGGGRERGEKDDMRGERL